eukprot:GILK01005094.1.p1 GENE.GILK01005094.1~~GILK01005094.1.p1  ORF type:complete len:1028 (-),score=137.62 GILK01005094.1:96-2873(-)
MPPAAQPLGQNPLARGPVPPVGSAGLGAAPPSHAPLGHQFMPPMTGQMQPRPMTGQMQPPPMTGQFPPPPSMSGQFLPPPPMTGQMQPPPMTGQMQPPPMTGQLPPPPMTAAPMMMSPPIGGAVSALSSDFNSMNLQQGSYARPPWGAGDAQQPQRPGFPQYGTGAGPAMSTVPTPAAANAQLLEDIDRYNCPKKYVRLSVGRFPESANLKNQSQLPLGAVFRPMTETDDDVPVVNFGATPVVRCKRCRSYINPFVQFSDAGRRWRCNICGLTNDIPSTYFCGIDDRGVRHDIQERPELNSGCVEIIAPSEYMVRPPQPPIFLFLIDVSVTAVTSGMLATCVQAIKSSIEMNLIPGNPRTQVGIITFDTAIHFYNLKSNLAQPQMLVVSDLEDIFLPLPDDMLVNLHESRQVVLSLLDALPSMFQNNKSPDAALGSALKAGFMVINPIGGKMLVFQSVLPTIGTGPLKHRDNPKLLNTEKETMLLTPADPYYKNLAIEFSKYQITVETFLFPASYIDVATIGQLSKLTGGDLYYYPQFMADRDGDKFRSELQHCLSRQTGWEGVFRIRVSRGWKITAFHGHFCVRGSDLLALPNVDSDKSFTVEIALDEQVVTEPAMHMQSALLYTTSSGERRIRVQTVAAPVTNQLSDLFTYVDAEVVCAILARQALETALTSKLADGRSSLQSKCSQILSAAQGAAASAGSRYGGGYGAPTPQQGGDVATLFPGLNFLAVYSLGYMKSTAFRSGTDVSADERVYNHLKLETMTISQSTAYCYPRMVSLHDLSDEHGVGSEDGQVVLPASHNLSAATLAQEGMMLLEDGLTLYLWIGRAVNPSLLQAVFGVTSLDAVRDSGQMFFAAQQNAYGRRVVAIVEAIQKSRPPFMKLYIIRQGDPLELRFFNCLVEDRTPSMPVSFADFMSQLRTGRV